MLVFCNHYSYICHKQKYQKFSFCPYTFAYMRCVSILPKAMNVYMCQHSVGEKCKFLLNIHVTCPALRTQNLLVLQQIGGLSQPKHCSPVHRLDLGAVVLVVDLGPVVLVVAVVLVVDLGAVVLVVDLGPVVLVVDLGSVVLVVDLGPVVLVVYLGPVVLVVDLGPVVLVVYLGAVVLVIDLGAVVLVVCSGEH